jgi:hypothetical protein
MKQTASYSFPLAAAMGTNPDQSPPIYEAGCARPFRADGDSRQDLAAGEDSTQIVTPIINKGLVEMSPIPIRSTCRGVWSLAAKVRAYR